MLSKAATVKDARAARAAEDADEERRSLYYAQRAEQRSRLAGSARTPRGKVAALRAAAAASSHTAESAPPSDSLEGFLGSRLDMPQVVAAALLQAGGPARDFADFRSLTRVQLDELLRAARLEGLAGLLWEALLKLRLEEGHLLTRSDLDALKQLGEADGP